MRKPLLLIALLFTPFIAQAQQQQLPPITIAIRAGKLIDVDHSHLLTNQIILIRENGTVAQVGPNLTIPTNAQTIDLSHSTVFPGLIDCHTHLADGSHTGTIDPIYALKHTAAEVALESVPNDAPSSTFIKRVDGLIANPPGDEWDGSWHLEQK